MFDLQRCAGLDHLRAQMLGAANAGAGIAQLAGLGAGLAHQVVHAFDTAGRIGQKDQRHLGDQADANQVGPRIEVHLFVQGLVHRHRAARHQQGVTIGGAARNLLGADIAARAGFVLHHQRLTEPLAQLVGQRTGKDIGGLAGWERHDQLDGLVWIGGKGRIGRNGQASSHCQCGSRSERMGDHGVGLLKSCSGVGRKRRCAARACVAGIFAHPVANGQSGLSPRQLLVVGIVARWGDQF